MNTRSNSFDLVSPLSNPERVIRHNNRVPFPTVGEMEQNDQQPPMVGLNGGQPVPDLRPMEEMLQTPFNGVRRAIVIPDIQANHFEINH